MSKRQRILAGIDLILERITRYLSYVAAACLVIMALLATTNVLTSKIIKYGIPSAVDWGTYLLIPVVFLSISYNLLKNGLIHVDFLTVHFPRSVNRIIDTISDLLGAGISGIISWRQVALAVRYFNSGKISSFMPLHFYIWPFCAVLGLGTGLMGIVFLWRITRVWLEKDFIAIRGENDGEVNVQ